MPRQERRRASIKRSAPIKKRRPARQARKRTTKDQRSRESSPEAVFHQVNALWTALANRCRQFAEGFNREMGSEQLRVEANGDLLSVRLINGAEVFAHLDRDQMRVECFMNSAPTSFGSYVTNQAPLGFGIQNGTLRFSLGDSVVSEDELATRLLTELTEPDPPSSVA